MTPKPIPIPAKILPISSISNEGATAITAAPAWKTMAANPIVHFLPIASEVLPPPKLPNRESMLRIPTRTSTCTSVIFKSSLIKITAPLITPTSAYSQNRPWITQLAKWKQLFVDPWRQKQRQPTSQGKKFTDKKEKVKKEHIHVYLFLAFEHAY